MVAPPAPVLPMLCVEPGEGYTVVEKNTVRVTIGNYIPNLTQGQVQAAVLAVAEADVPTPHTVSPRSSILTAALVSASIPSPQAPHPYRFALR